MQRGFSVFPDTKPFSILLSHICVEFQASSPTLLQGMNCLNMTNKSSFSLCWSTSSPVRFWIDLMSGSFSLDPAELGLSVTFTNRCFGVTQIKPDCSFPCKCKRKNILHYSPIFYFVFSHSSGKISIRFSLKKFLLACCKAHP